MGEDVGLGLASGFVGDVDVLNAASGGGEVFVEDAHLLVCHFEALDVGSDLGAEYGQIWLR